MSPTATTGAQWTINNLAAVNPSFIDRPWLAVFPSKTSANQDQVYISYHDFLASKINVAASNDGGQTFGPSVDVLAQNGMAQTQSFCNTIPSDIEVDPETGEVYVQWITADPVANTTQGCNTLARSRISIRCGSRTRHPPPGSGAWRRRVG